MPKVIGRLTDFGLDAMVGQDPRLVFRHSTPGVSGASVLASRPVIVQTEGNGVFEVELVDSSRVSPAGWYQVTLEWRDDETRQRRQDVLPFRLYVPAAGGQIGDLLRVPSNPAMVWTGPTPPPNPSPGLWWLYDGPDTDTLKTGDLMEWS